MKKRMEEIEHVIIKIRLFIFLVNFIVLQTHYIVNLQQYILVILG